MSRGFDALFAEADARGGLDAEDLRSSLLPLWREVAALHELGEVAPLRGLDAIVADDRLRLFLGGAQGMLPSNNRAMLRAIEQPDSDAFDVVATRSVDREVGTTTSSVSDDVVAPGESFRRPVFVSGFTVWEHAIGHHDEAADIESLGLLLASLALGLDFRRRADLEEFVAHRRNVFTLRPEMHPVIARLIAEMAEPERSRRSQDLASLAERLDTYRDQPVELDLAAIDGASSGPLRTRRVAIRQALRDRLFEIDRRNRLIWFRPTAASVNLTIGSVPLLLDYRNIAPEQVLTWKPPLSVDLLAGRSISLSSLLRFEDSPYLPGLLDKLIAQARRDRAEYGLAQLRLVVCFLRWHNLKEAKHERISSPLLLLPVQLVKKRGVRDAYLLTAESAVAEVNPALRHHLNEVYGIELPETIDLSETDVGELHRMLEAQIARTEPGVALALLDRPALEIVQQRARLRVDQYRRRTRAAVRTSPDTAALYSYAPGDLRPLGIQLFEQQVRYRTPESLRIAAGVRIGAGIAAAEPRRTSAPAAGAPAVVTESRAYSLKESRTTNPYEWELDLCALTIASFNYRKMTLVRDYAQLIAADEPSDSFDRVFSLDARPADQEPPVLALVDQHLVVPADASQRAAITRARTGRSFIIQGPPGTGKSQTITNLIADYVARGKRVLFVCEKRAAIDVVHARLRSRGLDELSALIHDSQADKREFVLGLKATYEGWLTRTEPVSAPEDRRGRLIEELRADLGMLERVEAAMGSCPEGSDRDLRWLLERASELAGGGVSVAEASLPTDLPTVADWYRAEPTARRIGVALERLGEPPVLARHPVANLSHALARAPHPAPAVRDASIETVDAIAALGPVVAHLGLDVAVLRLQDLDVLAALAGLANRLPHGVLPILLPGSKAARALVQASDRQAAVRAAAAAADAAASRWTQPLSANDADSALVIARNKEGSALRFLSSEWRAVKRRVEAGYDFAAHEVRPSVTSALELLVARHSARDAVLANDAEALATYAHPNVAELLAAVSSVARPGAAAGVRDMLAEEPVDVGTTRNALLQGAVAIERTQAALGALFGPCDRSLRELAQRAEQLRGGSGRLGEVLHEIAVLDEVPRVAAAMRSVDLTPDQLESAVVERAIRQEGLANADVDRFDGHELAACVARTGTKARALFDANAAGIRDRVRAGFLEDAAVSEAPAAQLRAEQKAFKKVYATGRRELEREFGKTMRYRSIRDIVSGPSGAVVMDLRPIWLMSPLSVSDTLPLDAEAFDVVIFDEASQIPLEEAVPALHRSHQCIVVGDRMQLPPTRFFSAARREDGLSADDDSPDADEGDLVGVVLEGDSFLARCAVALPSSMLTWHYRSRSESLIAFSNEAFYAGALATVPDVARPVDGLGPILSTVGDGELDLGAAQRAVDAALIRPVSFHFVADGVYEDRSNRAEAAYVAGVVRELLTRDSGLTVGVVAFSEAQQSEIEGALERLAGVDPAFAVRLDVEEQRSDDGQFVGLFVKNLENVQGDERDVIVISVCYAPGPSGRMLMNFGPINQPGGEKRLNVIFSRARRHMVVVSSIRSARITNEHNDGANTLRRFLEYAEALSGGEGERAAEVLARCNPSRRAGRAAAGSSPVVAGLAARLRSLGLVVELDYGRSRFRCDLAVRRPDDRSHRLAVLVDTRGRAALAGADEQALTHAPVLAAFGWRVLQVLTRDWWSDPDAVVAAVVAALG